MRSSALGFVLVLLLVVAGNGVFAVEFDVDGAVPGKWTMNVDAARKPATEKDLPILLDFSGSDWCSWHRIMEENVFTNVEWKAYATNNLMMEFIDFPRDKSLMPEKYVERNSPRMTQWPIPDLLTN